MGLSVYQPRLVTADVLAMVNASTISPERLVAANLLSEGAQAITGDGFADDLVTAVSAAAGSLELTLPIIEASSGRLMLLSRTDGHPTNTVTLNADGGGTVTPSTLSAYESLLMWCNGAAWVAVSHPRLSTASVLAMISANTISPARLVAANLVSAGVSEITGDGFASDLVTTVSAAGGSLELTLPALESSSGRLMLVRRTDGTANTVTLNVDSGGTVTPGTLSAGESLLLWCDGTEWVSVLSL